jgi:hypothetical protein
VRFCFARAEADLEHVNQTYTQHGLNAVSGVQNIYSLGAELGEKRSKDYWNFLFFPANKI